MDLDKGLEGVISLMTAIIGVAIVAVLVSKNSNTGSIISSFGTAFSGILSTAVSPVTGGTSSTIGDPFAGAGVSL